MLDYIEKGKSEGTTVLCGGGRAGASDIKIGDGNALEVGAFVLPTVFTDCQDDMSIVTDEIFGPVMSILSYQAEEEVIRRANDTDYGLAAGVVTPNLN